MAFTETEMLSFEGHFTQSIAAFTHNASSFGTLQLALDAVEATGGVLNLDPITYTVSSRLHIENSGRFKINGNNATIFAANTMPGATDIFEITACRNFRVDDLTIDGNKEARSGGVGMGLKLVEPCSTATGGGGYSIIRVTAKNCPEDGHRLTGDTPNPISVNRIPRNGLYYKCRGDHCGRVGMSLINGYNIQVKGGFYNDNGKGFGGALPSSGIDMEPNPNGTVIPGCDQFLYKGITFKGNNRTGMSLSPRKDPVHITVDGCLFDGNPDVYAHETIADGNHSHAGGLTIKSGFVLVTRNTFQNFGTHYNGPAGDPLFAACIYMTADPQCHDNLVTDNLFINNACTLPVIRLQPLMGTGNAITLDRFSGNAGGSVDPIGGQPGKCTVSGITTSTVQPTPTPPVDVTFAEEGGGGGNLPIYVAKLGETIEADATAADTTDVAVTIQNVPGSFVMVSISFADQSALGQAVSSVILDPGGASQTSGVSLGAPVVLGTNPRVQALWGFTLPPAITDTIRVTYNQAVNAARVTVHQYRGVATLGTYLSTFGTGGAQSLAVPTLRNNSVVFAGVMGRRGNAVLTAPQYTPGSGMNERTDNVTGGTLNRDMSFTDFDADVVVAGTVAMSCTSLQTQDWAIIAQELQSSSADVNFNAPPFNPIVTALGNVSVNITNPSNVLIIPVPYDPIVTALGEVVVTASQNVFYDIADRFEILTELGQLPGFDSTFLLTGFDEITVEFNPEGIRLGWIEEAALDFENDPWVLEDPLTFQ